MRFTFFFRAPAFDPCSLGDLAEAARLREPPIARASPAGAGRDGAAPAGGPLSTRADALAGALAGVDWDAIKAFGWPCLAELSLDRLPAVVDGAFAAIEAAPELQALPLDDVFQLVALGLPTLKRALESPANLADIRRFSFRPAGSISTLAGL